MHELAALARNGVLRAAINTGNRALVQQDEGLLKGISPALARRLAEAIGAEFAPVIYDGAGLVFADSGQDRWDVAFLALDPKRAEHVSFTRPYVTIEATFAARADAPIQELSDVDKQGVRLLTSRGSAYELYLSKTLKYAQLDRIGTPPESFEAFREGNWDAVAGVRASLVAAFGNDAYVRVLPDALTKVKQAMVLPGADNPTIKALDTFVSQALAEGFVASHWKD